MKALVSGIGGDIGFGAAKILGEWGVFESVFGIDVHSDHPGGCVADRCFVAPKATDPGYLDWVTRLITDLQVDLFIPTSESEINVISRSVLKFPSRVKVLVNSPWIVDKCLDKNATLDLLCASGVRTPSFGLVGDGQDIPLPVIVKPRSGRGSAGVFKVDSSEQWNEILAECRGYVWQKYLPEDLGEFTCAVYRSKSKGLRVLCMQRTLVNGRTNKGIVQELPDVQQYVRQIADVLHEDGCYNVQLRRAEDGPFVFEVNPRLSSTLVFRDRLGFPDLKWWICDTLGWSPEVAIGESVLATAPSGTKFYRIDDQAVLYDQH